MIPPMRVTRILVLVGLVLMGSVSCELAIFPSFHPWRPWYSGISNDPVESIPATIRIEIGEIIPGAQENYIERVHAIFKGLLWRKGLDETDEESSLSITVSLVSLDPSGLLPESPGPIRNYTLPPPEGLLIPEWSGVVKTHAVLSQMIGVPEHLESPLLGWGFFAHRLTAVVTDENGSIIHNHSVIWVDIEQGISDLMIPACQIILSPFPTDPDRIPIIAEVPPERADAFFNLNLKDNLFTSSVLPFIIRFPYNSRKYAMPRYIKDSIALRAYLDLIQTAEWCLPTGMGVNKFDQPDDELLWSRVRLGGTYRLAETGELIHVLVTVKGTMFEYEVSDCRVVEPNQFEDFTQLLDRWKAAVTEYIHKQNSAKN